MKRVTEVERVTKETKIRMRLDVDGTGECTVATGIPFFDHMLTLFSVHGFFDLSLTAVGDLDVDSHHTIEDVGLVLGDALNQALGERGGIRRFGFSVVPMDEAMAGVTVDLSRRPYLVYRHPDIQSTHPGFNLRIAREFFRAFAVAGGMNLHIDVPYGENEHHMVEAIFKSLGRALDQAVSIEQRVNGVRSSKGLL